MKKNLLVLFLTILIAAFLQGCGTSPTKLANIAYKEGSYKGISKLANNGNAQAQYYLGHIYEGKDSKWIYRQDIKKAIEWYSKAATQNNIDAKIRLGAIYLNELKDEESYKKAYKIFTKLSKVNHINTDAKVYLADMYYYGRGIEKNYSKALELYTEGLTKVSRADNLSLFARANSVVKNLNPEYIGLLVRLEKESEQGVVDSQYILGKMLIAGEHIPKQIPRGLKLLTLAEAKGNVDAQYELGITYLSGSTYDINLAIKWLRKASESGKKEARLPLAKAYKKNNDTRGEIEVYTQLANEKNIESMLALGGIYEGLSRLDKAKYWYTKAHSINTHNIEAKRKFDDIHYKILLQDSYHFYKKNAEQGSMVDQFELATIYAKGNSIIGVTKNLPLATSWYKKSAEQGYHPAQNNLGLAYQKGRGVKEDLHKAKKWFEKASVQNNDLAQLNLGILYYSGGQDFPVNKIKAYESYLLAAKNGNYQAQNNLDYLCNESPWACK